MEIKDPALAARIICAYRDEELRPSQIAAREGIELGVIRGVLDRAGIVRTMSGGRPQTLTASQEDEAVVLYLTGMPASKVGVLLEVSDDIVLRVLQRKGVTRTLSEARRLYPLNQSAFDELDEATAYWIGLLMADGAIFRNSVGLGLKSSDREHVQKFIDFLQGGDRKITECTGLSVVRIRADLLAEGLARWGVGPRKSFTARPQRGVDDWPSFWRGMIDGDGWITRRNGEVGLGTGSDHVRDAFVAYVRSLGCECRVDMTGSIHRIMIPVADSGRLLQHLYPQDVSPALARKSALAHEWLSRWEIKPVSRRHRRRSS